MIVHNETNEVEHPHIWLFDQMETQKLKATVNQKIGYHSMETPYPIRYKYLSYEVEIDTRKENLRVLKTYRMQDLIDGKAQVLSPPEGYLQVEYLKVLINIHPPDLPIFFYTTKAADRELISTLVAFTKLISAHNGKTEIRSGASWEYNRLSYRPILVWVNSAPAVVFPRHVEYPDRETTLIYPLRPHQIIGI